MQSLRVRVLHGPNLNLLGQREPELYGNIGLEGIQTRLDACASTLDCALDSYQSNHEGELVDLIQDAAGLDGFLVNPGGLGHTSVCLRDAFLAVGLPFVEVHCSNVAARESFRRRSLLSDIAIGVVQGFGADSYELGLRGLVSHLRAGSRAGG